MTRFFRGTTMASLLAALGAGCSTQAHTDTTATEGSPRVAETSEGYLTTPDGVELYYRTVGSGPQAVVLPGRLFLWDDFRQLAPGRRLIFYDMRNRGRSDAVRDTTALGLEREVQDLEAVRRHFGLQRFSLVGYSYLGLLAVLYALEHPEAVERLVQIGPVPRRFGTEYPAHLTANDLESPFDSAAVARARALREVGFDRAHPHEYCEIAWSINRVALVGDPANVDRLGEGPCTMPNEWPVNLNRHLRFALASVQRLDLPRERVAALRVPVLTIHGTRDRNAPYGGGLEWASTLADARLLSVPGAAHSPWVEAPSLVFPAIDTFLRGEWPASAERVGGSR